MALIPLEFITNITREAVVAVVGEYKVIVTLTLRNPATENVLCAAKFLKFARIVVREVLLAEFNI